MFNMPFEMVSSDKFNGMIVIDPTVTIIIQECIKDGNPRFLSVNFLGEE